jgi:hypothetical protein
MQAQVLRALLHSGGRKQVLKTRRRIIWKEKATPQRAGPSCAALVNQQQIPVVQHWRELTGERLCDINCRFSRSTQQWNNRIRAGSAVRRRNCYEVNFEFAALGSIRILKDFDNPASRAPLNARNRT